MKHVVNTLLGNVTADQLMEVLLKVADEAPIEVMTAFNEVLAPVKTVDIEHDGTKATIANACYAAISQLMSENKKVSAIKELRFATGWSLKASKEWVEETFNY